jgi:FkbM family methyltransferase
MGDQQLFQSLLSAINSSSLSFEQLGFLERCLAVQQGKGWDAATISHEISSCCSFFAAPPRLLIDIGGNRGLYAKEFLARFPGAACHVFEPSSLNVALLRDEFRSHPGVNVVDCALSDVSGVFTLYADEPGSGLGSLTQRRLDHFGIDMKATEDVRVVRFDDYWSANGPPGSEIDYVKIDVEGHELAVLRGFGELARRVKLFQFEFGGTNIDTRTFFSDFWYFFLEQDFSLYRLTPRGLLLIPSYQEAHECFQFTNYIAVNNRFAN